MLSESELLQDKQMPSLLNGCPLCPQIFCDQFLKFQTPSTMDQYVNLTAKATVMEPDYTSHQTISDCLFWQQAEVTLSLLLGLKWGLNTSTGSLCCSSEHLSQTNRWWIWILNTFWLHQFQSSPPQWSGCFLDYSPFSPVILTIWRKRKGTIAVW